MPYPPTVPPATRANTTPSFNNHPGDHNMLADAIVAIIAELGNDPSGVYADLTARLNSGPPIGSMVEFAGTSAPAGWLMCDGSAVSRATYPALHAVMQASSYPWGAGDGSTTFNVPDRRGRVGVGRGGSFPNLNSPGGNKDATGVPSHTHTTNNHAHTIPNHQHPMPHAHTVPFRKGYVVNSASNGGPDANPSYCNAVYTLGPGGALGGTYVSFLNRNTAIWTGDPEGGPDQATGGSNTPNTGDGGYGTTVGNEGAGGTSDALGGGTVVNANMPPYVVVNHIIKAF